MDTTATVAMTTSIVAMPTATVAMTTSFVVMTTSTVAMTTSMAPSSVSSAIATDQTVATGHTDTEESSHISLPITAPVHDSSNTISTARVMPCRYTTSLVHQKSITPDLVWRNIRIYVLGGAKKTQKSLKGV